MNNINGINLEKELEEYKDILFNSPLGEPGRKYLQSRNINKETAEVWSLGYCPVGYIPKIYKDKLDIFPQYKKMFGRLVIPIYSQDNCKILSISGRRVIEHKVNGKIVNPKYDHYVFNARKVLFGLNINKRDIFNANRGIITEGQFDVITAWQNGVNIVTSSFGAHAGEGHLALMSRYTKNVIILYDGDAAGKNGLELMKKTIKGDLQIELLCPFPQGQDMDSWLRNHTKEEFFDLINKKDNLLQQKLNLIRNKHYYKWQKE